MSDAKRGKPYLVPVIETLNELKKYDDIINGRNNQKEIKMLTEQWNNNKWEEFEARLEDAETQKEVNDMLDLTRSQKEHPKWYDSACLCWLCRSRGD